MLVKRSFSTAKCVSETELLNSRGSQSVRFFISDDDDDDDDDDDVELFVLG